MSDMRTGGPAPAERASMIVTAVLGVLALLAVLGIGLFSSDKAGGTSGLGGGPGGGEQSIDGSSNGGGSNGSASTGTGSGSTATGGSKVTVAYLRAHFPLPPGAVRTHRVPSPLPGEKDYDVPAGIASVKAFYDTHIAAVGLAPDDHPATDSVGGRIDGYFNSLYPIDSSGSDVHVSLDMMENIYGNSPGIVTIQVTISDE
jgi:hypothetical protein